jgi:hypothetical protein
MRDESGDLAQGSPRPVIIGDDEAASPPGPSRSVNSIGAEICHAAKEPAASRPEQEGGIAVVGPVANFILQVR